MEGDLKAALDAFDRVVAAAADLVPDETLDPIARTVRDVRDRAGYLGDTVVVAVAGGTGSGKSSLVNSMAGEVVSESGGMRPTTGIPLAWIPHNPEPGLTRLLDDLGIDQRVGQDSYPWLAVIDLPDTDSVVADHRHTVEALLPRVDLVMWVIDPEKYQDRLLHEDYLRPLAAYDRQFVFVLNQIDRIDPAVLGQIRADLESTLADDGIASPIIEMVAADPSIGPPIGVDGLIERLEERIDVKRTVFEKLATDLKEAARHLSHVPELSGGVGFDDAWDQVRVEAATVIARGDRSEAVTTLNGFVEALAESAGGGAGSAILSEASPDVVAGAVEVAYENSGAYRRPPPPPPPVWFRPVRMFSAVAAVVALVWAGVAFGGGDSLVGPLSVVTLALVAFVASGVVSSVRRDQAVARAVAERQTALVEPITRHLDTQLARPLRRVLRQRSAVTAAATELNLALAELERRLG